MESMHQFLRGGLFCVRMALPSSKCGVEGLRCLLKIWKYKSDLSAAFLLRKRS